MATFKLQPIIGSTPTIAPYDDVNTLGNTIRYVGNSTPNTTVWNANDVWVDTQSPTTPVVRVWSGSVFQPARSSGVSLFTEYFNGTDGVTVPTGTWAVATTPASGSGSGFTYSGNTGWLKGGTGSGTKIARSIVITNPTDCNISTSLKFPSGATPQNMIVWARANSALDSSSGYSITITPGKFYLNKWASFVATDFNPGGTAYNYAPDTWYSVRLRVVGTTVQGKIWLTASAEPATWTVSTTDSSITAAGYIGVQCLNATGSGGSSVYIDNFIVDPT